MWNLGLLGRHIINFVRYGQPALQITHLKNLIGSRSSPLLNVFRLSDMLNFCQSAICEKVFNSHFPDYKSSWSFNIFHISYVFMPTWVSSSVNCIFKLLGHCGFF